MATLIPRLPLKGKFPIQTQNFCKALCRVASPGTEPFCLQQHHEPKGAAAVRQSRAKIALPLPWKIPAASQIPVPKPAA
ncbi:hypothetical protein Y1Q_0016427 [Alligator mississippiensis]|uniref:Uncharacterized protein n=1 Tax=Alligator mississippiensis TaxID=8496 RepID=A0A151N3B3_ALLMI|nr:hypothetical protein Y1Q_0016427 [Alligator mississippiensis]